MKTTFLSNNCLGIDCLFLDACFAESEVGFPAAFACVADSINVCPVAWNDVVGQFGPPTIFITYGSFDRHALEITALQLIFVDAAESWFKKTAGAIIPGFPWACREWRVAVSTASLGAAELNVSLAAQLFFPSFFSSNVHTGVVFVFIEAKVGVVFANPFNVIPCNGSRFVSDGFFSLGAND